MSEKLSRRNFLKAGGLLAAAGAAEIVAPGGLREAQAQEEVGRATLPYPAMSVAQANELEVGQVQNFTYPDDASPCVLLKAGQPVPGGVGPDGDIVAYSSLCSHQGCPVTYDGEDRVFKCFCHFSIFDPEKTGQVVCGQATVNLPQIVLEYNAEDDAVTAVAVKGLIYGRQSNIL